MVFTITEEDPAILAVAQMTMDFMIQAAQAYGIEVVDITRVISTMNEFHNKLLTLSQQVGTA